MKNIFLAIVILLGLTSCNGQKLSTNEKKLIEEIGLPEEIALKIKKYSTSKYELNNGNPDRALLYENIDSLKTYSNTQPLALKINAKSNNATKIVAEFGDILFEKNIIIYKSAENYGNSDDVITILKSKNKFEPLLFEATNAVNYNIYTPQIIERLKLWDSLYGIKLTGAGMDFVSGEFIKKPNDISKFSQEMYEFCPDIVDQGVGDVKALEKSIQESNDFFLWWD
ncbi:MAG: hypothetical protein C4K58_07140 [Flavobacteriaceae bacterium]|nr:MAG: hypothetical protein C4K58_07140 [Flavobacteriaceae bacterium]